MTEHYLTPGERIAAHLSTHLPEARVQVALSLPLAALDSLRSGQDGIYVLYRGAAAPETAVRRTHARIPQRWGVVVIVRWLSDSADNPALPWPAGTPLTWRWNWSGCRPPSPPIPTTPPSPRWKPCGRPMCGFRPLNI